MALWDLFCRWIGNWATHTLDFLMPINVDPNSVILGNDFFLDIVLDHIPGGSIINKFGANTSVGTGGEMISDLGGSPIFPTTASSISISSASQEDTASGIGVDSVTVIGLNELADITQETIDIDASIAATSTGSFLRIYRMFGAALGSAGVAGGTNVGAITATIGGSNIAQIGAGNGQTLMAWFTMPRNFTGVLLQAYGSTLRSVGGILRSDFLLFVSPSGGVRRIRSKWGMQNDGTTFGQRDWGVGDRIDALDDIYLHAVPSTTADISGGFTIICFREDL
jgi:hypothetical protein